MSASQETHRARIHSASDATKTTLSDLLATSTNQVNPLIAASTDEVIEFDEETPKETITIHFPAATNGRATANKGTKVTDKNGIDITKGIYSINLSCVPNDLWRAEIRMYPILEGSVTAEATFVKRDLPTTLTPPRVGEYWQGQGGFYAGIIRDGDWQWHLLLAAELIEVTSADSAEPEFIRNASQPVIAAWGEYGVKLAGEFSARDGMHNTYLILASDSENEIASHCTALLIDGHKDFYWPAQHEVSLLCANLPEHFTKKCYWSSTQFAFNTAEAFDFFNGEAYANRKHYKLTGQAVRRILID